MAQETRVTKLDPRAAEALERALRGDARSVDAEWRTVAHARFSVKTPEVVATCYESGKLVVQGKNPEAWMERFQLAPGEGGGKSKKAKPTNRAAGPRSGGSVAVDVRTIGSDETGKGDYFGPIVVTSALVRPEHSAALVEAGVADSKTLTDPRAHELARQIRASVPCAVVELMPEDYNREYAAVGNLNTLLARMHAQAILTLLDAHEVDRVIVDRFTTASLLERTLAEAAKGRSLPELIQEPRAERYLPVGAASIVARAVFLEGLARCEQIAGVPLHKGAGAPVDRAGRGVLAHGGRDLLAKVAKMHFKNTSKIGA